MDIAIDTLVEEQEYAGIVVHPLTLGRLVQMAPAIAEARRLCSSAGLTVEQMVSDPLTIALTLAPVLPDLVAGVTGKTHAESEALPLDSALGVILISLRQNVGYLRKLFVPALSAAFGEVAKAEGTPGEQSSAPSSGSSPEGT